MYVDNVFDFSVEFISDNNDFFKFYSLLYDLREEGLDL